MKFFPTFHFYREGIRLEALVGANQDRLHDLVIKYKDIKELSRNSSSKKLIPNPSLSKKVISSNKLLNTTFEPKKIFVASESLKTPVEEENTQDISIKPSRDESKGLETLIQSSRADSKIIHEVVTREDSKAKDLQEETVTSSDKIVVTGRAEESIVAELPNIDIASYLGRVTSIDNKDTLSRLIQSTHLTVVDFSAKW